MYSSKFVAVIAGFITFNFLMAAQPVKEAKASPTKTETKGKEMAKSKMPSGPYCLAAPIVKGKLDSWKKFLKDIEGSKKKEWDAFRKATNFTNESVWHQVTPMGDFAVICQTNSDPKNAMKKIMEDKSEMGKTFKSMAKDIHGMDMSDSKNKMPPNSLVLSYESGTTNPGYAFVVPIVKGKEDSFTKFSGEIKNKWKDFEKDRSTNGFTKEVIWRQDTPNGSFIIVYQESADRKKSAESMAKSKTEFGKWLLHGIKENHGVDLTDMSKTPKPNEKLMTWSAK